MKLVVAGKGGVGKTTVSATVARALGRSGADVVAVDADINPMLGLSLGLGIEESERLAGVRETLQDDESAHVDTVEQMIDDFGTDAPDGVRVVIASRMDRPDSGCGCCGVTADRMLGELEGDGRTVLGDLEAGVGVLSKMASGSVDLVLVVVNPNVKSIEVARRAIETAVARESRVLVIANRVRSDQDLDDITAALGEQDVVVIPEDPVIGRADVEGRAPIDVDGRAPGVQALVALGERLAAAG